MHQNALFNKRNCCRHHHINVIRKMFYANASKMHLPYVRIYSTIARHSTYHTSDSPVAPTSPVGPVAPALPAAPVDPFTP